MNTKKCFITGLVVFVVMFILDYLFHALLMQKYYMGIEELLRPQEIAFSYFPAMLIGQILIAFGFTYLFVQGYEGKGVVEGIRFGLIVGIVFGIGPALINYSVYKLTGTIMLCYFFWYPIECMILGAIAATLYKSNGQ